MHLLCVFFLGFKLVTFIFLVIEHVFTWDGLVVIRYRSTEESLFQEKESVRSQLEMLHEEKAKLSRVRRPTYV